MQDILLPQKTSPHYDGVELPSSLVFFFGRNEGMTGLVFPSTMEADSLPSDVKHGKTFRLNDWSGVHFIVLFNKRKKGRTLHKNGWENMTIKCECEAARGRRHIQFNWVGKVLFAALQVNGRKCPEKKEKNFSPSLQHIQFSFVLSSYWAE